MTDWPKYVERHIEMWRSGDADDAFHSLIDDASVLGPLVSAYHSDASAELREFILAVIREHRRPESFEILAEGLGDKSEDVWKSALDGLVVFGHQVSQATALSVLHSAVGRLAPDSGVRLEWINEAIEQVRDPKPPFVASDRDAPA